MYQDPGGGGPMGKGGKGVEEAAMSDSVSPKETRTDMVRRTDARLRYSGYLDASQGRHIHYWFIRAESPHADDLPTTLWVNATDPTKLYRFPFTWAKQTNMLYIEAPVGVGFSYADDPSTAYECDDDTTAEANMLALNDFFKTKFPELKKNPFFITGESYAALKASLYKSCEFEKGAPVNGTLNDKCAAAVDEMHASLGNINLYNVYGECVSGTAAHELGQAFTKAPLGATRLTNAAVVSADGTDLRGPDACINSILGSAYLNQPSVVKATHVKPIAFRWATCATADGWSYKSTRPNLPRDTYPLLVKNMRVIIYNGDWDSCVPWTDNEAWTSHMGFPVRKPWHVWSYSPQDAPTANQVGGYATTYDTPTNFTFLTIRGGRHEVPETAPEQAFEMLRRLLSSEAF
eukprot:g18.t1